MAKETVKVRGLRDLNKAFDAAGKEAKKEMRAALREVADPVKQAAEAKAAVQIRGMSSSPAWSQMRIGVTRGSTYVAPKRRSTKVPGRKRPNLAKLLMERAMLPALEENRQRVNREMEKVLDEVGKRWERE